MLFTEIIAAYFEKDLQFRIANFGQGTVIKSTKLLLKCTEYMNVFLLQTGYLLNWLQVV
jgi:hypothetical protein